MPRIMNPIEALFVAFMRDVSSVETLGIYFLIGLLVAALLERPITRAGYPMEWLDRFWVILGWPLAMVIYIVHLLNSRNK